MEADRKMPTYEYECRSCGHISDVFHSMTVKRRIKCPECGGGTKKLIGAGAGIIFKGTGFYETDYKRKSGNNGRGPGPGDSRSKGSESGKEKSSESKAESKSGSDSKSDSGSGSKSDSEKTAKAG